MDETRRILAGAVAVAQFANDEWVDDPDAIAAGYQVTSFDNSAVGDAGNPPYLEGPGAWEPAFQASQAWRQLGIATPMTVDYRPAERGDTIALLIDGRNGRGEAGTVAIDIDRERGLYADARTIEALGGRRPAGAPRGTTGRGRSRTTSSTCGARACPRRSATASGTR